MTEYKSDEERHFAEWLKEGEEAGLIEPGWAYESESIEIVPKQLSPQGKVLFRPTHYTPDFTFTLTAKGRLAFPKWEISPVIVDVKGGFDPIRKDHRYLTLLLKLLYFYHNTMVYKIEIPAFFLKSWVPESMWWTKKGKPRDTKVTRKGQKVDAFVANIKGKQQELL